MYICVYVDFYMHIPLPPLKKFFIIDAAGDGAFITWCRFEKGVRFFDFFFLI
jgi:hypothetical protein